MDEEKNVRAGAATEVKRSHRKYASVKPIHVISMIIALVIAVFVVIQLVHMVNYTLGNEMDINKMWLYEWVLNLGK